MGIFEGRLKRKAQMLVESTSLEIGSRDNPGHTFATKLHERVVEAEPQILTTQPPAPWGSCDVHQEVGAVEVLIKDTSDQPLAFVNQSNCRPTTRRPSTAGPGTHPRADDIILTDENLLQSTPPVS